VVRPLDVSVQGELRPEQQAAADAMLTHDTGVVAATTAFGKTVVAVWLKTWARNWTTCSRPSRERSGTGGRRLRRRRRSSSLARRPDTVPLPFHLDQL
jgi:hypothetical protein